MVILVCVLVILCDCKLICGLYFKFDIGVLKVLIGFLFVVVEILMVICLMLLVFFVSIE